MLDLSPIENQIQRVTGFQELVSTPLWKGIFIGTRQLTGDFAEIVQKVELTGNIAELSEEQLNELQLSADGQLAREILLNDLKTLESPWCITGPKFNSVLR